MSYVIQKTTAPRGKMRKQQQVAARTNHRANVQTVTRMMIIPFSESTKVHSNGIHQNPRRPHLSLFRASLFCAKATSKEIIWLLEM
jgi:hypothetical protein